MKITSITTILHWAGRHPVQVALFSSWFTFLITLMAFRDDLILESVVAYAIATLIWIASYWHHCKKYLLLAVALTLAFPSQAEPEPKPVAGVAVGVVVICAGGFCVYKVIKFCNRKFPKSTNSQSSFSATGDGYAGAYEYSAPGSCYVPPPSLQEDLTKNPTTFTLGVAVNGGSVTTTMSADASEGSSQDWAGFAAEMATHGLHLTGRAQGDPQYAVNGNPCEACVPFSFDPLTGRVIHATGGPLRRVVVERSVNLQDWSSLLVTDVGDGAKFSVVDTSRLSQAFYRVSVATP